MQCKLTGAVCPKRISTGPAPESPRPGAARLPTSPGAPIHSPHDRQDREGSMRAAVLHEVGKPMTIEEIERPVPKDGEVLVRIVSTGVCHTDLHVIKGEVAFPTPCVLGHETSGLVEALGPGVRGIAVGDQVVCPF